MSLYIWLVAGVWRDDTAWVLWQDQWDKGDEYALNMLAVHCPKCPAKFVNNVYVRDGISRTLAGPAVLSSTLPLIGQVGGAARNFFLKSPGCLSVR